MRLKLKAAAVNEKVIVDLFIAPEDTSEQSLALRHCSPHRHCLMAMPETRMGEWKRRQTVEDHAGCADLLQPVVVLWDQFCWSAFSDQAVRWQQALPDSLITRSLLERLRWCDDLSSAILCLQMLLLEAELNDQRPVDSSVLCESLFEIDHGSSIVLSQELVRLEHGTEDLADSGEAAPC